MAEREIEGSAGRCGGCPMGGELVKKKKSANAVLPKTQLEFVEFRVEVR